MTKRITGAHGKSLPDLGSYSLSWNEVQKLIDEESKLWRELRTLGRDMQEVEASLPALRHELQRERAAAVRSGDAGPTGEELAQVEERLRELSERQGVLRQALEMSHAELLYVVEIHREEWKEALESRASKAAASAERVAQNLRGELRELDELESLAEWLENPERGFGVSYSSEQGIDTVLANARWRASRRIEGEPV